MTEDVRSAEPVGESVIATSKLPILNQIVYDFVTDCRKAVANGENQKFINLVEIFIASFPYPTKSSEKMFENLETEFSRIKRRNALTQGQKANVGALHLDFAIKKYAALTHLLKEKNMYPKPAEIETYE